MRLNYPQLAPKAMEAMYGLERYISACGLEKSLIELVKIRASQLNGCAACLDMHTKDARAAGESEQRLYLLSAWREASFYTPRERAALELTEAVTRITDNHVPDELFERARRHFTDEELVNLTFAIATINSWNRIAITFGREAGTEQATAAVAP